jgi:YegS/Rv2252/BmrU family lipid kinase
MNNHNGIIIFILNPISGFFGIRRKRIESVIKKHIKAKKIQGEIWHSEYSGHTTQLVKQAVQQNAKMVVIAGGDGSINEAARALIHTETALGIIPCGSGNGLARHLKIPFNINKALQLLNFGKIKKADILKINNIYAFSVAGIGLDAMIARRYHNFKKRGLFAYMHSAFIEYVHYISEPVTIKSDNMEIHERCAMIVCANANQFGYNFRIAPQADLFDGFMDIVIVKDIPFISAPLSSIKVWVGHANRCLYISTFKAKKVTISRTHNAPINIDGDPYMSERDIEAEVIPASLNIIVPQ